MLKIGVYLYVDIRLIFALIFTFKLLDYQVERKDHLKAINGCSSQPF